MKHLRGLIVAMAAMSLTVAPAANADPEPIAPPFTNADAYEYCRAGTPLALVYAPTGGTCSADADSTAAGVLSAHASIGTGELPTSSGYSDASAYVGLEHDLDPAAAVIYTVTYRVSGAHYVHEGESPLGSSYGSTVFSASAYTLDEEGWAYFGHALASPYDDAAADGTYTRRMVLKAYDGTSISGPVHLDFWLAGWADAQATPSATVSAGADVEILSVTSRVIV